MEMFKSVLLLTESDIHKYELLRGFRVDILLVPKHCKAEFLDSEAYRTLYPMMHDGKILYYEEHTCPSPL